MCYSYLHRLAYAINHRPIVSLYILHVIFSPLLGKWTVDIVATHAAAACWRLMLSSTCAAIIIFMLVFQKNKFNNFWSTHIRCTDSIGICIGQRYFTETELEYYQGRYMKEYICTVFLWIDPVLKKLLPSNSNCMVRSSKWNKHCPQIIAAASGRSVWIICDHSYHAGTRAIRVVRVVFTVDTRTERLRVLLTASSNHRRLTHTYLI